MVTSDFRPEVEIRPFGACAMKSMQYNLTGLILRTLGPFNVSYSAQRLDLFAWCVRLSQLQVGFRTHLKSLHFHSFIHSFIAELPKFPPLEENRKAWT